MTGRGRADDVHEDVGEDEGPTISAADWTDRSLRHMIDLLPDMVCQFTPDGTLLYVNLAYADFHDRDPEDMVGRTFTDFVAEEVRPGVLLTLEEMQGITPAKPVRSNIHQSRSARGELRWHEWTDRAFFDDDGRLLGFMTVGRDMTERVDHQGSMERDLIHDELTGVLNRRGVLAALGDRLVRATEPFAVGFVDINRFKAINDRLGHRTGDQVLQAVAAGLRNVVGATRAGRFAGDEFIVWSDGDPDELDAELLASVAVATRRRWPDVRVTLGWTIAAPGEDIETVIHRADSAMYARRGTPLRRAGDPQPPEDGDHPGDPPRDR